METTVSNAVLLSGIGMITVFAVLLIVVFSGSLLISIVNKYATVPVKETKFITPLISNKKIAVITAVVDHVTQGKGKVESIEKIK